MNDAQFERYLHVLRMSYPDRADFAVAVAREGYACGAEQMRERCAKQSEFEHSVGTNGIGIAAAIRNLPVGESSRAPEGSQ